MRCGRWTSWFGTVPDAQLVEPTDAVVHVSRAAICGSDLWPYKSMPPSQSGRRMGHELIGVVESIGSDVQTLKVGQLVVAPFLISDGTCGFCREGLQASCVHGGRYGSDGVDGGQGEAVRVPYADGTLVVLPVSEDRRSLRVHQSADRAVRGGLRMATWSTDELNRIGAAEEVHIAGRRADGTLRKPVIVWIVRVGEDLYVRSVNGRNAAWFRGVQARHEGRLQAEGVEKDVDFLDVSDNQDQIDAAYGSKYARYPGIVPSILTPETRATTLRLVPHD